MLRGMLDEKVSGRILDCYTQTTVLFDIYDRNSVGFIELSDMLAISKSTLASAVYLTEISKDYYKNDEHFRVSATQFDMTLHTGNK